MATSGSRLTVVAAFLGNLAIAVAKFVVAAITGSAAMLSEGFHSVADTGNQAMLLWGMRASSREPSARHPFGSGKETYFWSFMVAVMLFAGGAVLAVRHGLDALRETHELESLGISIAVLAAAIVIEGITFGIAFREFDRRRGTRGMLRSLRASKDAPLVVVLLEDSAAMTGLLVAMAGTVAARVTGEAMWDGIASLVIGVILGVVAFFLAFETKALLVGESAGRAERSAIRARLLALPEVEAVGPLLTMQLGPDDVLVNVELELRDGMDGAEMEQMVMRAESEIRQVLPEARNVSVEVREVERG
jgi:cation diffusion facilitator family transporter